MKAFIAILVLSLSIVSLGEEQSISPEEERALALFEKTWQKIKEEFSGYDLKKPDFIFALKGDFFYDRGNGSAYYSAGRVVLPYDYINFDDDNIMSVLVHEIGHAILTGTKTQIISENPDDFTSVDSICEGYEGTNPVPKNYHDLLTTLQKINVYDTGNDHISKVIQPRGIPTNLIFNMLKQPFAVESNECSLAYQVFETISKQFKACHENPTGDCDLSEKRKEDFETAYEIFVENARICFEGKNEILHQLVREHPENWKISSSDQIKLFDHNKNPIDILLELSEKDLEDAREIHHIINGDNIRYLSEEDEADLFMLLVMGDSGKYAPLFDIEVKAAEEKMKKCVEYIEQSGEPYYGSLSGHHHSSCWRLWRNEKIRKELQEPEKREQLKKALLENNPTPMQPHFDFPSLPPLPPAD